MKNTSNSDSRINKDEKYDIRKDLDEFETLGSANKESDIRQKYLFEASNSDSRKLGIKLTNCEDDNRCGSAACPICMRAFRQVAYAEFRALLEQYSKAFIMTVILYFDALTSPKLFSMGPIIYKQRLYQQLKRAGFKNPVIGYFDIDYHSEIGLWLPHFHLLVLGEDPPFEEFKKRFYSKKAFIEDRSTDVNRPVVVQEVKDPAQQISYLFKSYWSRVEAYDVLGKRRTKKYRLMPSELRLSLRVMDRVGFSGFLLLYRVRRNGGQLVAVSDKK